MPIGDHVIESRVRRPGAPEKPSDAELVGLAVAQVLLGARSEHRLQMCYGERRRTAGVLLALALKTITECPRLGRPDLIQRGANS